MKKFCLNTNENNFSRTSTLNRIVNFPEAWHPLSQDIRRCQTKRFPYGLIYSILDKEILIIAVSNLHRKPNHWDDRQ